VVKRGGGGGGGGRHTNPYFAKEICCALPYCCLERKLEMFASQNVYDTKYDFFRYVAYGTEAW